MRLVTLNSPLIVGSGVAGSAVALSLPSAVVMTDGALGEGGSSDWAQGGIAAAIGPEDSTAAHAADTIRVSGGLADQDIARLITGGAPEWIDQLIAWGARFDRNEDGHIALGREAGHSDHRIVHAFGDATGRELMRTLRSVVRARESIEVLEKHTVIDLLMSAGRVAGVIADRPDGERVAYLAPATVLATGGIGRLYLRTTNPLSVTGDGIAMAARVGAELADLEFVQFHPTALASGLDPMPLLTEALRGAGAVLVDNNGHRYMLDLHRDAELAPRDVVARANFRQEQTGQGAFLDATHLGEEFPHRFPTVFGYATAANIDPRVELLPVSPAVHYFMGGIATDSQAQSSVPGLWAVGECSSSGLHGANRLASNSLLEGLVMGARAAQSIAAIDSEPVGPPQLPTGASGDVAQPSAVADEIRSIMWEGAGVERIQSGLLAAQESIAALEPDGTVAGRNALVLADLIVSACLARTESRGGHYRLDFPELDPTQAERSSVMPRPVELRGLPAGVS